MSSLIFIGLTLVGLPLPSLIWNTDLSSSTTFRGFSVPCLNRLFLCSLDRFPIFFNGFHWAIIQVCIHLCLSSHHLQSEPVHEILTLCIGQQFPLRLLPLNRLFPAFILRLYRFQAYSLLPRGVFRLSYQRDCKIRRSTIAACSSSSGTFQMIFRRIKLVPRLICK